MDALFGTVIKQQRFETDTFAFDVEHETDSLTFYLTDKKTGKMYVRVIKNEGGDVDKLHFFRNGFFDNIVSFEIADNGCSFGKIFYKNNAIVPYRYVSSVFSIFPCNKEEYVTTEQKLIAYFDEQQANIIDAINNCCFDKNNYADIPEHVMIPTKDIPHTLASIFKGVTGISNNVIDKHRHPLWRKVMLLRDKLEEIEKNIITLQKGRLKDVRQYYVRVLDAMKKDGNITKTHIEKFAKYHCYVNDNNKTFFAHAVYGCSFCSFTICNFELQQNTLCSSECQFTNIYEYTMSILPPPTIKVGKFAKIFADANDIYKVAKQLVAMNPKFKYENLMKIYDWIDTACIDLDCDDVPACKFVYDVLQKKLDEIEFDEVLAKQE